MKEQSVETRTVPEGWNLATWSPGLEVRLVKSYLKAIPDALGVDGFLRILRASALFVNDEGWIAVTDSKPGLTAQFHGAKWADGKASSQDIAVAVTVLLDWLFEGGNFVGLIAFVPSRAKGAVRLVQGLGGQRTGIVPLHDTWDGEPDDLEVWFLKRR